MKLRHIAASPFVRKVMVVAEETGLAPRIEKQTIATLPVSPHPALTQENPLAKVPSLTTDGGEILYDSSVIAEYLDALHDGTKLFPPAGPERWTALRRQALGDGIMDAAVLTRYERAVRPAEKQWPEWVDAQLGKVRRALDLLEGEDLAGPFDIGRITVACALGYLDLRYPEEDWRKARPHLAAWFAEVSQRPSMQATHPHG
jgi:glutathione S-transferase